MTANKIYKLDDLLSLFNEQMVEVRFVQIGAHDGMSGDPIHQYIIAGGWTGILVEPVKYLFNKLVKNYKGSSEKLHFVNAAIGRVDGPLIFNSLKEVDDIHLPYWYNQLGSFNLQTILKHHHTIPNIEKLIISEYVDAISIDTLLRTHTMQQVDLMIIDTEGYDLEVLRSIDFKKYNIKMLIFEHKHLSDEHFKSALELIVVNGYTPLLCENDLVAVTESFLNVGK